MKKKALKIVLIVLGVVIAAIAAAVIYFWPYISAVDFSIVTPSNIKVLYQSLTQTPEETAQKKKDIDSKRSQEIREYLSMELRDYTDEEKAQIESGEKTETEILVGIIQEQVEKENNSEGESKLPDNNVSEGNTPDVNVPDNTEKNETAAKESSDAIVARNVQELYGIQSSFEGRIAALAASAKNWVHAYKAAHPGITWREAKVAGVQHFSGTAASIEDECYAKVDGLIEKLRGELKAIGADTSIADTIKQTAYGEMDAKKAEIVQLGYSKLNKPG